MPPDRLSRTYAYQVLLIEEFARHGVETIFLKAPQTPTAEDQLLVQFQGMIAEYERAQILERSRRGKRHRAHQGQVSVLSGAPYGYRYVRRSDDAAAYYEARPAKLAGEPFPPIRPNRLPHHAGSGCAECVPGVADRDAA